MTYDYIVIVPGAGGSTAAAEHRRMVGSFRRALLRAGCLGFSRSIPLAGAAHACGTLVTDPFGKVHGLGVSTWRIAAC